MSFVVVRVESSQLVALRVPQKKTRCGSGEKGPGLRPKILIRDIHGTTATRSTPTEKTQPFVIMEDQNQGQIERKPDVGTNSFLLSYS